MNCTEFENAVEHTVETRGSLPPAAIDHGSICAHCQPALMRHQLVLAAIAAWRETAPPPRLIDNVIVSLSQPDWQDDLSDLIEEASLIESVEIEVGRPEFELRVGLPMDRRNRRKSRSGRLALASLTACLIVAAIATMFSDRASVQPLEQVAQLPVTERQRAIAQTSQVVSNTLTRVFSNIRSEYDEMASETNSAIHEVVNVIPQRVATSVMHEPEELELLPDASDLSRMWQPIGTRVETALGFLLHAVPGEVPSG